MNGTPPPATAAGKPVLFEVNLIRDRIDSLRRRRRMQNLSMVGSLLMLLAGGVVAAIAGSHVLHITGQRGALESDRKQLLAERILCNRLDRMRDEAMKEIGFVTPLLTVSRNRIEWSVKLSQFAAAVGPAGGIDKITADSGDIYADPAVDAAPGTPARRIEPAQFTFAVLMPASLGPKLLSFSDDLNATPGFTTKLGPVQIESQDLDSSTDGTVAILHGSCKVGGGRP